MPKHIPPVNRRQFLSTAAVTAAGWLTFGASGFAADSDVDPDYYLLLADTHIDRNSNRLLRGVNTAEHLDIAVKRIVELHPRPAAVIINGDAANIRGYLGEYGLLSWILRPLSRAGIPVHITMGNHDDRGPFYTVLADMEREAPFVDGRHLDILETPNVYLFLLDTLDQVNQTPGLLGERQLEWLDRALAKHADKPVILFGHHFPETGTGRGLQDIEALYAIALSHPHVKAYFYGHSHRWELGKHEDLHLVNQPATGYVFREEQPGAYVHARFQADRVELKLDCIDREHPWHGQTHSLAYR
jgi:3',5'-cyclic-AMP phosphodiesterase